MTHLEALGFKAALADIWANPDADPDVIFARQGLAIVPVSPTKKSKEPAVKLVQHFVDELTHDAGLTVSVKERLDGPQFEAIDVIDIRRFADEFFDD